MKELIKCNNISLSYDGVDVLKDISFSIYDDDYLCIVGENGSGKSTLIKCLLGIKKADKGEIIMNGGLKHSDIGYLPQQTSIQKGFPATVEEVVISGCLSSRGYRPFYSKKEKQTAEMNMKRLGILDLRKRCYRELSGGQQQRVLLARALCAAKKLILLDEPVTGLDPVAINELYNLIGELNQSDKITIIMVSHDIQNLLRNTKHVLHLNESSAYYGSVNDYLKSEIGSKFIGELK
ncbi:MAG TPA: metal ABC transporter ATP-binding protein [Ruminococcus sp.]|nr:metal ABC transporter ATP-binding protein [Ruminococcus sp.]HOF69206.1 metal ABC transporter ATP-binding protein [Ruminococcus sp.]